MTSIPKTKAVRLNPSQYRKLRDRIWERDNNLCRVCGIYTEHSPHHIFFRGRGGSDIESNMVTVCMECHDKIHKEWINLYGTADNLQVSYKIKEM